MTSQSLLLDSSDKRSERFSGDLARRPVTLTMPGNIVRHEIFLPQADGM